MSYRSLIVKCPRCGRTLTVPPYAPDVECDCHLYCEEGSKPQDCVTEVYPFETEVEKTIYASSSDGHIYKTDSNYATAWNSATGTIQASWDQFYIGQRIFGGNYTIWRAFLFFDTSVIPRTAIIKSAVLSLYGKNDASNTDFDITIQNGQPAYPTDPLATGDYNKSHYAGDGGTFNTVNFGYKYLNISLTNTALKWINREGTTKLCLRSSREIAGTVPTGFEDIEVWSSEKGGVYKPKLVVTYTKRESRQYGWPGGMHTDTHRGEPLNAVRYCSTHDRYIYKEPIIIEVDWSLDTGRRLPTRYRRR